MRGKALICQKADKVLKKRQWQPKIKLRENTEKLSSLKNSFATNSNNIIWNEEQIEEIKEKHEEYKYYVIVDNDFSE